MGIGRKILGKRLFGRQNGRWEDNISMDLGEVGREGVDWMHLAQNRNGF
jgi:hypothetical protein